jgi:hypothetical protein
MNDSHDTRVSRSPRDGSSARVEDSDTELRRVLRRDWRNEADDDTLSATDMLLAELANSRARAAELRRIAQQLRTRT